MAAIKPKQFQESLEEYSVEGLEVLQGTSSLAAHAIIYLVLALLLSLIAWAFFTKADVVITTKGTLVERTEPKKVYSPVEGELIESFVSEGVPVAEGDLIARIKSSQAIQIAAAATQAKLNLESLTLQRQSFPREKELLERELDSLRIQIELLQAEYEQQKSDGLKRLSDGQKRQLEMLRLQLEEKRQAMLQAEEIFNKYQRLSQMEGGGGISRQDLLQKQNEFDQAQAAYKQMAAQIEDAELGFAAQNIKSRQKIEKLRMEILEKQLQFDQKQTKLKSSETELEMKYRAAQEAYEAASRITFEDLDDNNFLAVRAPVAGEVTSVTYKQPGEQVTPSKPVALISKEGSGKVLTIRVQDKDRGLLQVGQEAKIKFHAFPYQRFGFLKGKLQYLSRNAETDNNGQSLYKGTVSLEQDHYLVNGTTVPVRFGMNANVEIVTQRRRLIDFVIDPFRKASAQ